MIEAVRPCHYVHTFMTFRDVAVPFIKSRIIAVLYEAESEHGMLSVVIDTRTHKSFKAYNYKMFTFDICLHEIERNVLIFESVQCDTFLTCGWELR
jgi:hypothetical protein